MNAYKLLVRRWQSKYLRGVGELLRAGLGAPHLPNLLGELHELRLWALVYAWWLTILLVLVLVPNKLIALGLALALVVAVIGVMSLKYRSVSLGFYAVTAWCFHAAALPLGFFHARRAPADWIESRVLHAPPSA